ncbi:SUMO conjugating enzyme Hus5 [Rhodotorula kratochvilovae]
MAQVKRERTASPPPAAPRSASRALQSSIALLSASSEVPPALYAQLLASLSDACGLAVAQEAREDERDRKRVKVEERDDEPPARRSGMKDAQMQTEERVLPLPERWGLASVQGELSELERMVLRDVEAGLPLLDKLGILLRPLRGADGKISLLEWETALPMPAGSNWTGALPKPRVIFAEGYPAQPPKVKLSANFYHPNVFPSGTIGHKRPTSLKDVASPWARELAEVCAQFGVAPDTTMGDAFVAFPPRLRLPILLKTLSMQFAFEDPDNPSQLEAYTTAKKDPDAYLAKIRAFLPSLAPSPQDIEDQAEARRRAVWRTRAGVEPGLLA